MATGQHSTAREPLRDPMPQPVVDSARDFPSAAATLKRHARSARRPWGHEQQYAFTVAYSVAIFTDLEALAVRLEREATAEVSPRQPAAPHVSEFLVTLHRQLQAASSRVQPWWRRSRQESLTDPALEVLDGLLRSVLFAKLRVPDGADQAEPASEQSWDTTPVQHREVLDRLIRCTA